MWIDADGTFTLNYLYMMGYGTGSGMAGGAGLLMWITWLVILVDLILAGIWL